MNVSCADDALNCGLAARSVLRVSAEGPELDHYATLGVSPEAAPAAIRAAYLDLMRRYHPDMNSSAAAAAKTRAITAAYAALSTSEGRANYDLERQRRRLAQLVWPSTSSQLAPPARWRGAWLPPFIGIVAVLLIVPMLFEPPSLPVQSRTYVGGAGERKGSAPHEQGVKATTVQSANCSSPAVSTLVTRALFGRALRLAPSSSAQLRMLIGRARVLSAGAARPAGAAASTVVQCEAVIALDLPTNLVTSEGAKTVEGTVGYVLKPANGDARRSVGLTSVGSLPETLSTIRRATDLPRAPMLRVAADPVLGEPIAPSTPPMETSRPSRQAPPLRRTAKQAFQNPSFSCQSARTEGALLVCNSAFLAALDREMAALYGNSAAANPAIVPLLRRIDSRFLARRDACSSESCAVSAYFAAINELQDIRAVSARSDRN